jgi:hypothetical protein
MSKLTGTNGHEAIHAIGVRSKTAISKECFEASKRLLCVGCYCIGTDNHALDDGERAGIPVFNAPYANTRSVAELVISQVTSAPACAPPAPSLPSASPGGSSKQPPTPAESGCPLCPGRLSRSPGR